MNNTDIVLVKLDTAKQALAEAKTIQETKQILDVASAAEILAKRQKLGEEAVLYATAVKVEALAQLGRMLKETPMNAGSRGIGVSGVINEYPTLADLGLDKKISKLAQDIARLDESEVEKVKQGVVSINKAISEQKREQKRKDMFVNIEGFVPDGKVINGDCRDELAKLENQSIDLIYIDPPYNVGKDTWDNMTERDFTDLILESVTESLRILKKDSHLFIHFPAQKSAWLEQLLLDRFSIEPASRIIWHYRNLVMGRDSETRFLNTYQPILHYSIGNKPLNFNVEWNDERFDVWTIATPQSNFDEGKYHITQKPIELLERIVSLASLPKDTILDFFAGSGTTGVAAQKLGRNYLLVEKERKYVDVILQRLAAVKKSTANSR